MEATVIEKPVQTGRPEIRNTVIYRDSYGADHLAFVTSVWGEGHTPALNLAYVASGESQMDAYGRQILRATSIPHASYRTPVGICWRHQGEEMPPPPEPKPRATRR